MRPQGCEVHRWGGSRIMSYGTAALAARHEAKRNAGTAAALGWQSHPAISAPTRIPLDQTVGWTKSTFARPHHGGIPAERW